MTQNTLWKKVHWTAKIQHTFWFCTFIGRWERPITAKTHGGTSWSSTQVKVEKAQKIKGLLNVFGAYDHTNDKIHVHCYRNKTAKVFIDFLKRVDKRYDKNIQNIFVVLDNISVHKSKKVMDEISKYCPRIKLVFLPGRSPELNRSKMVMTVTNAGN